MVDTISALEVITTKPCAYNLSRILHTTFTSVNNVLTSTNL
jgi:hypothetical protein